MKKKFLILVFILFSAQSAFALSFSANGDVYIPTGSYGDMFNVGYGYGLSAEHGIFPFTGIKLSYHRYHTEGKSADNQWYSKAKLDGDAIELMLRFAPFDFIVEPYVAAGGGYYSHRIKTSSDKFTQDGFGFVGEAGFNVNFFMMSAGLNAKYFAPHLTGGGHSVTADSFTVSATLSVHLPF